MSRIQLRSGHDRRIRNGHPWIFSNEIATIDGAPQAGDAVDVFAANNTFLGRAYYNAKSLIAARLLSRESADIDSVEFFRERIAAAASQREKLYPEGNGVRLVYGESDGLPGLVVDRYGDVLSLQFLSYGIDCRRDLIVAALQELFAPTAIVVRNDVAVRTLEGLPQEVAVLAGNVPDELLINEHGLSLQVDVLTGQKTGHFLDQKENHLALRDRVAGQRVLDLFCYSGGWSLHAAKFGAKQVTGIDISTAAVALATQNAARNGFADQCNFIAADVFDELKALQRRNEHFGTIILDPPAFVKSKKQLKQAAKGYLTVNRRALELLEPNGYLLTCSCSYHMGREDFLNLLRMAAAQAGRTAIVEEVRGQSFDHPVALTCPETDYLKCVVLRVM